MAQSGETVQEAPLVEETAFQRDMLVIIAGNPGGNGLSVKEALDEVYSEEIHHGRLYPNLDTLVDRGLVSKGKKDDRTNTYSLTDRGRRELEAHFKWAKGIIGFDQ